MDCEFTGKKKYNNRIDGKYSMPKIIAMRIISNE